MTLPNPLAVMNQAIAELNFEPSVFTINTNINKFDNTK